MHIYLHIGYPKTGSSAIQTHLFTNQHWFEERGVYVPRVGFSSGKGHAHLLDDATEGGAAPAFLKLAEELEAAKEERGFNRAVISWEGFAGCSTDKIATIAHGLVDYRVTLLAYVREQARLFESATLQHIKRLRSLEDNAVINTSVPQPQALGRYDFAGSLERWESAFSGGIEIRTRIYERARLRDGNVVIDFLEWLGLTSDDQFALQEGAINLSHDTVDAALLSVVKAAGLDTAGLQRFSRALSEVQSGSSSAQGFLSADKREEIGAYFSDSNTRLFNEFQPENANPGERGFNSDTTVAGERDSPSLFDYLKAVHGAVLRPTADIWNGGVLAGVNLGRLTQPPGAGWRGADATGIWSCGPQSDLVFMLPALSKAAGPHTLRLSIRGRYRIDGTRSRITVRAIEPVPVSGEAMPAEPTADIPAVVHANTPVDIGSADIDIPLSDSLREQGVHLRIDHDIPSEATAGEPGMKAPVFKLQSISYGLIW